MNNKRFLIYMNHEEYNLRKRIVEMAFRDNQKYKSVDLVMKLIDNCSNILLRFRPPFERELNALNTRQIFLCRASCFEDSGDCEMLFDFPDLAKYFVEEVKPERYQTLTLKDRRKIFNEITSNIVNNKKFIAFKKEMRGSSLVACFSDNYAEGMWQEYAQDSQGFCAIYNIGEIVCKLKSTKDSQLLFYPVRYVENRKKCSDLIFTSREYSEAYKSFKSYSNKYCLSCMTKDLIPYSKEGEWRLIKVEDEELSDSENGKLVPFINPECIILGKNIFNNPDFKSKLETLAKDNNIPIYTYSEVERIIKISR